jgi:choloylglycine hydrolase
MALRPLLSFVCVLATLNASLACTAVDMIASDGTVIAGRTME